MDDLLLQRLREAYAVPLRAYHSFEHAALVATWVEELGGSRACLLAAWFHDAVYEAGRPDNEEASAALLLEWLGPEDPDAAEAARLVRVTAGHEAEEGDEQAAILCDADLAVLGGTPEEYEAYRRAVRREYAFVSDEAWAQGRAAVLRSFLERPQIYRTPAAQHRWEEAARRNVTGELAALGGP